MKWSSWALWIWLESLLLALPVTLIVGYALLVVISVIGFKPWNAGTRDIALGVGVPALAGACIVIQF